MALHNVKEAISLPVIIMEKKLFVWNKELYSLFFKTLILILKEYT
eukprot:CAMPEP_0114577712 /NCGR_PEP_ID=MMETSP0125-20121206/2349_1 /TAXON_ID=485358 ORGANISM="Aristerostoma sp., Strain ATCC 50986" /NCGR_SAMPLE_ID=MMETSP0125 /ASSEMBLY_ACC=CAM_ASM_000245 /LENGTH=44 /DNA_ID= /DNA_START= /DNA_END= /DNA_ORIENTATION=